MQLPVAEDLLKNVENFALAVGYLLNTSAIVDNSKIIRKQNFSMLLLL